MSLDRSIIRYRMMSSWKEGGKRAKLEWLDRWRNTGHARVSFLYYFVGLFGLSTQALYETLFYGAAVFLLSVIVGMQYDWYNFAAIRTFITQIFDPFVSDVRERLDIADERKVQK